eukprot:25546-Pelagococcus_subviridis.AAC.1
MGTSLTRSLSGPSRAQIASRNPARASSGTLASKRSPRASAHRQLAACGRRENELLEDRRAT